MGPGRLEVKHFLVTRWHGLSAFPKTMLACLAVCGILAAGVILSVAQSIIGTQTMSAEYAGFFGLAQGSEAADPDNDGLTNLEESRLWTDPLASDTDEDVWPDNIDGAISRMYVQWGNLKFVNGDALSYTWPRWAVAASKAGGDWTVSGGMPCWHATASQTPSPSLNITLDRSILRTTGLLRLALFDHAGSSLIVSLCDSNNNVVADNLFGNLLTGRNRAVTLSLEIPLARYPAACSISIRCTAGEATVYESLFYVDRDNDGMDADQELQLGTSDVAVNIDNNWPVILDSQVASGSGMGNATVLAASASYAPVGAATVQSASAGFPASPYSMKLSFPKYARPQALTNFPVLVALSQSLPGFLYSQFASPNGWDLRFANSNGTAELNYEIEKWNVAGTSYVWVKIPVLAGTNTTIYAYWGNASQTIQQPYTTNGSTWSASYAGVWHIGEGGTISRQDSTANRNTGSPENYNGDEATAGMIGNADRFDGLTNDIKVADATSLDLTNKITVSAWIKGEQWAQDNVIFRKENAYRFQNRWDAGSHSNIGLRIMGATTSVELSYDTAKFTLGQWYNVACAYDSTAAGSNLVLYVNGLAVTAKVSTVIANSTIDDAYIGKKVDGTQRFKGIIDEVQVSSIARSSNWIWACWLNTASNAIFNAYGPVRSGYDTDGDGLTDAVETGTGIYVSPADTGTSAYKADSDGDGIADGVEVANRTNPNSKDVTRPTVVITIPAANSTLRWIP